MLFVEKGSVDAVWIPLHRERAILEMRKEYKSDLDIVGHHLALGKSSLGIVNLVEIGNGN